MTYTVHLIDVSGHRLTTDHYDDRKAALLAYHLNRQNYLNDNYAPNVVAVELYEEDRLIRSTEGVES